MKEQVNKIVSSLKEFWAAQEKSRKTLFIGLLVGIVVLAVVLTIVLNIKHEAMLFDGLETEEATAIVTEIQNLGITDVRMAAGGKVYVPEDQEANVRMQLGILGYPKNPLNNDMYTKNVGMFTTDSEKKEYERMAAQEWLMATIKSLDNVEDAIVTLVIPDQKNTVININPKQSSASVVVRLKNNAGLSEQQLSGIRHIVLTAVEGLTEENITITDGAGNLLETGSLPEDTISLERNKLNFKKEVEDTIRSEVGKMFVPIYSEKGFNVSVSSVLNYDKEVSEDTKYTPSNDNGSGMVEHEDTKNNSGTDGTIAGGVGVDPNAGDDNPTGTAGMGGAWSNSENSTSYLVNTLKKQTEKQGYTVEDLTVSVMIYTELLSDEDIAKYTTAVARAAGITEDFVSVMNAPKGFEEASKTPTAYPFGMSRTQFFMYIITLVMVIIFFMVLYANVSKRAKKKRKRYERMAYELATNVQGGSVEDKFAGQRPQPGSVASLRDSQNVETKESAVRREIADFSDNSPEVVAQLLKSWLREESDGNGGSGGGSRSSGKSGGK